MNNKRRFKKAVKKRTILFIIVLTSLSLIGIVVMQSFWIHNALVLKEKQFEHRVSIALKSIVFQLRDSKNDTIGKENMHGCREVPDTSTNFITSIRPGFFDTLVKEEFTNMKIETEYEYAIFKKSNKSFVLGKYNKYKNEILNTESENEYCTSLSCLWRPDSYLIGVYFPRKEHFIIGEIVEWIGLSAVFLIIVVWGFSYVILSLFRQKKLSVMITDFVNNMTHEFKTPVSTVSLASEMLLKAEVNESPVKTKRYAKIISEENNRLKAQVELILQIAVLDKGSFELKKRGVNLHMIIEQAIGNFDMLIKQRNGVIIKNLEANMSTIFVDPVHITNIVHNLIDNANKYSPENPDIKISTMNVDNGISFSVEDRGIGISSENQKNVFKKFYRVHTGNIHDVKGFGLGLYYVKTIVEAHGGTIKLYSELGQGTKFEIFLPFIKN